MSVMFENRPKRVENLILGCAFFFISEPSHALVTLPSSEHRRAEKRFRGASCRPCRYSVLLPLQLMVPMVSELEQRLYGVVLVPSWEHVAHHFTLFKHYRARPQPFYDQGRVD